MKTAALHVVKQEPAQPASPPSKNERWKDERFKYVRSESTDISKTFARIRREQAAAAKKEKRRG